jgi:hypothetical protein
MSNRWFILAEIISKTAKKTFLFATISYGIAATVAIMNIIAIFVYNVSTHPLSYVAIAFFLLCGFGLGNMEAGNSANAKILVGIGEQEELTKLKEAEENAGTQNINTNTVTDPVQEVGQE